MSVTQNAPTQPEKRRITEMTVRVSYGVMFKVPNWVKKIDITAGMACFMVDGEKVTLPAGETFLIQNLTNPLRVTAAEGLAILLKLNA